jgi:hypothetical protein
MIDEPRPDIDRRLRDAFAPDPAAVRRVAENAGARPRLEPEGRHSRLAARAAALCVTGGAVLAVVMLLAQLRMPPPVAEPEPGRTSLSGSFTDGLLAVSLPDGSTSITSAGARDDRPPDGYGIVLVEGEIK